MVTVDFADVECLQHQREWKQLASLLVNAAQSLERGGADFIVLCTNTMHKLADAITAAVEIPLLHIVDATAAAIYKSHQRRVGPVATKFTMEQAFYAERMRDKFGIEVIVLSPHSRQLVHDVIYQELCYGLIREESRERYQEIIRELAQQRHTATSCSSY